MGWLVFGTLGAVLAAELYFMFKHEEEKQQEEDCKCNCGCCGEKEAKLIDLLQGINKEDEVDVEVEENKEEE